MEFATEGSRRRLLIMCGIAIGAAPLIWLLDRAASREPGIPRIDVRAGSQAGLMCPWREPEQDMEKFFPGATGYRTESRILSGERLELARRLGRPVTADENAVYLHRVTRRNSPAGTVMVQRVRGRFGAIEIVAAMDEEGRLKGVRLQRHREPTDVAVALSSSRWLGAFTGRSADDIGPDDAWIPGAGLPELPSEAIESGQAVADGVRSLLVLYDVAQKRGLTDDDLQPHH